VRTVTEPFVAGLYPIPKVALLPLLLVLLGIGDRPRLALVALAAFFPLLINTMSSVRGIEPAYLEAALNYGARGIRLLLRVILPASLPGVLTGVRIAVNSAMTIAITTELLTARNGLGARIWMAWETLRTENLYAVLIVIALTGLVINWLLTLLTRRLMPWSPDLGVSEEPC
jgi:NitT/TauT family transport system permease protein